MNSFLCFALLFAAASAAPKPQSAPWGYPVQDEPLKPASWYGGSVPQAGYWPSFYSPSVQPTWNPYKAQPYAVPAVARADWEADPASWTDASYIPKPWTTGYYSAGLPVAKLEKQIVPKKVVAQAPVLGKLDQVQPVADPTPKLITYSTEITHDVPSKKEDVSPIVPAARTISIAPAQYSAWSEDAKPATWSSGVKPVGWTSEVKPASWSWAEPKPASWAAWAPETKPSSWSSWSEPKPWSSYVSPVQPAFYGASWGQPVVSTNAHHAISAPWSSGYPVSWTDPIQKRSDRKPF